MNCEWVIGGVSVERFGESLFRELSALAPENVYVGYWHLRVQPDDPRIAQVKAITERHGVPLRLTGEGSFGQPPGGLLCYVEREYTKEDLENFEYLHVRGRSEAPWNGMSDETGPVLLDFKEFRGKVHLRRVRSRPIVVSDHLRRLIEQSGLRHAAFAPTAPFTTGPRPEYRIITSTWESVRHPPWWHLTSDLTLPPLSLQHIRLIDGRGKPYPDGWNPDQGMGCWIVEDWYQVPEAHYRARDIRAMEPFDFAVMREPWGHNNRFPENQCLIVSQRFRRFCDEHKVRVWWQPVRLDPD